MRPCPYGGSGRGATTNRIAAHTSLVSSCFMERCGPPNMTQRFGATLLHEIVLPEAMACSQGSHLGRRNGNCLQALTGHQEPVSALAWATDQRWVASGALSIHAFAFGTLAPASAFVFWRVIGPMSVQCASVSRGSNYCPEPGTALSASGGCQAGSCCKCSRVTRTASTRPFSTRARLESCQVAGTGRSDSGRSARHAA